MALSIDAKRKKALEKQLAAQVRARNKQLAKLNDPVEKEKKLAKQRDAQERSRQKQLAKLSDPNYQKQQRDKKIAKQQSKTSKPTLKRSRPKSSRGLKGRTPTALERSIMNAIGKQCCVACLLHGRENPVVSLHHIWGRVIENAHAFVLPLCCFHHDTLLEASERAKYPDMIPLHAKGKYGGKAQWHEHNGTELDLLYKVYEIAGLDASIIPKTH